MGLGYWLLVGMLINFTSHMHAPPMHRRHPVHRRPVAAAKSAPGEVETIEPIAPATTQPAQKSFLKKFILLIGHYHAALVHFPIAWFWLWVLLEWRALWWQQQAAPAWPTGLPFTCLVIVGFLPAMFSGWLRSYELPQDIATQRSINWHSFSMYLTAASIAVLALWQYLQPHPKRWALQIRLALLIALLVVVGYGAHWGGSLVYGEDFLNWSSL